MLEQPESSPDYPCGANRVAATQSASRVYADPTDHLPLDEAELSERCLGNSHLVQRILAQVESALSNTYAEIDSAIVRNDMTRLAAAAHQLKGTAANVGAAPLRHLAWEMETLACDGAEPERLQQCQRSLIEEQDRLMTHVAQLTSPATS